VKKGFCRSEEDKKKLSISGKKFYQTPEGIARRKEISEFNKTKVISPETGRKISESNKGRIVSSQTRQKISKAHIGTHHSDEARKNISLGHTGKKYPNRKRLSAEDCEKDRQRNLGKHATEETKAKMRLHHRKKNPHLGNRNGSHHTEESKQKMSLAHKGRVVSFEERQRCSINSKNAWKNASDEKQFKMLHHYVRISYPQQELYLFLKQLFPDATLEYSIKTEKAYRFADIGIPSLKIDFEYDGYSGKHGHNPEYDKRRDLELANLGWITFRVNYQILKKLYSQPQVLLTKELLNNV
jgi:hypothetical protein